MQSKTLVLVLVIAIAMVSTVRAGECKMICNDEVRICKLEFCLSHSDKFCKRKCNKIKKDCMALCKYDFKRIAHAPNEAEEALDDEDNDE